MNIGCDCLSKDQVSGDHILDVFQKYGLECKPTDFAVLSGSGRDYYTKTFEIDGTTWKTFIKSRTREYIPELCEYSEDECYGEVLNQYKVYYVRDDHLSWKYLDFNDPGIGIRPIVPFSSILPFCKNKVRGPFGLWEVECGFYPQTLPSESELDNLRLVEDQLVRTGQNYPIDFTYSCVDRPISKEDYVRPQIEDIEEYEYQGNRYVSFFNEKSRFLRDGRRAEMGKIYWLKVEPIKWIVSETEDLAVAKNILVGGVAFQNLLDPKEDFKDVHIKKLMDTLFLKSIQLPHPTFLDHSISEAMLQKALQSERALQVEEEKKVKVEEFKFLLNRLKTLLPYLSENASLELQSSFHKILVDPDWFFDPVDTHFEINPLLLDHNLLPFFNLVGLPFDNVKVSGINWENTNASFNPQTVYRKDLSNSKFCSSNFTPFDNFRGADIRNSDFSDCLPFLNLQNAISDSSTIYPDPDSVKRFGL